MQKRPIQRGRPAGATTFDAELAQAFGAAVRALRTERGIAQESLANLAGIERSHMGKVERGEHMPTLDHLQDRQCARMQHGSADEQDRRATGSSQVVVAEALRFGREDS